jgi:hypothetical protein
MKKLFLLAAIAACAWAQSPNRYSATTGDVSLSGAGTKLTIQQPSSNGKPLQLEAAVVYCSVACDVTQTQNGTAATATAGTATPILPFTVPALATIFTASNVGSGTQSGGVTHLSASSPVTFDLSKIIVPVGGTASNYTFSIASITGTANITIFWSEQQ